MTPIAELFAREDANSGHIYLYPEGAFYKAYLRSAFLFRRDHGDFKPVKRAVKSSDRPMISIGFPRIALPKYFPDQSALTTYHDGSLSAACDDQIDIEAYDAWAESLPLYERAETPKKESSGISTAATRTQAFAETAERARAEADAPASPTRQPLTESECRAIVEKLRAFRVDSSSPMECMLFVAGIQKEIDRPGHAL